MFDYRNALEIKFYTFERLFLLTFLDCYLLIMLNMYAKQARQFFTFNIIPYVYKIYRSNIPLFKRLRTLQNYYFIILLFVLQYYSKAQRKHYRLLLEYTKM